MRNDRHMTVSRSLERLTLEYLSAMDEDEWARRRALAAAAVEVVQGSGSGFADGGRPAVRLDGDTWVCEWPRGEPLFTISRLDLARGSVPSVGPRAGGTAGGTAGTGAGVRTGSDAGELVGERVFAFPEVYPLAWRGA